MKTTAQKARDFATDRELFSATQPAQGVLAAGDEPFIPQPGRIVTAKAALEFILAGNAYFTLRSAKTGTRYTYRGSLPQNEDPARVAKWGRTWFCSLLSGPDNEADYTYLGIITAAKQFKLTAKSRMNAESGPVKAISYALACFHKNIPLHNLEVWHEGRCGRCGRKLTVPESIAAGIGSECAFKMGGRDV